MPNPHKMCKSGGYIVKSNHFIMNQLCISTHFNHITAHLGKISFRNLKWKSQLEISNRIFNWKSQFRFSVQKSHFENRIRIFHKNLISKTKLVNLMKISFRKLNLRILQKSHFENQLLKVKRTRQIFRILNLVFLFIIILFRLALFLLFYPVVVFRSQSQSAEVSVT